MTLSIPPSDLRQLLPLADAMAATYNNSVSAFYRWCDKWRVSAYRHGLYQRAELAAGIEREEQARKRRGRK